jgi:hypothetical protein
MGRLCVQEVARARGFATARLQRAADSDPKTIQAEEEQVGRALPTEKAQCCQRIIETGDLVALTTEDDLEDLVRGL